MYTPDPARPFELFPHGLPVEFRFHWRGDIFRGGALFTPEGVEVWADPEDCRYSPLSAEMVLRAAADVAQDVEERLLALWAAYCAAPQAVHCAALGLIDYERPLPEGGVIAGASRALLVGAAGLEVSRTEYDAGLAQRDWEDSDEGARLRRQQEADERAEADACAYESWKERRHAAGLPVRHDE